MIAIGGLDSGKETPSLLAASGRHFGRASYQASGQYLHWLYGANPESRGYGDCIVARQADEIVGCMHRMILPMRNGGHFAALHNHFIDPASRSGAGVLLLRQSTKGADVAIAPGVEEKLGPIYQRLRFHEVPGAWLAMPLSYPGIVTGIAKGKVGVTTGALRVDLPAARTELVVTATPSANQIGELRRRMMQSEAPEHGIAWTDALVRWRYFDPNGPRHLLVLSQLTGRHAVVALGARKGVRTARLMECAADPSWVRTVAAVARKAGASLGLAFTAAPMIEQALREAGWRQRTRKTSMFSTSDAIGFVSPAATDLGFEAFLTEIH